MNKNMYKDKYGTMHTIDDLFDEKVIDFIQTPAYKLVRNNDPSTSHAAAEQLDVSRMEKKVLQVINMFPDGCISDDVLDRMSHIRYSTVTARYKQLKEKGLVIVDGTKRKGKSGRQQLVMWSKENYTPSEYR
tara:strand:+ start:317 stop:712 length:396 start_codon:yes stop_codon:yes gene_type:complete